MVNDLGWCDPVFVTKGESFLLWGGVCWWWLDMIGMAIDNSWYFIDLVLICHDGDGDGDDDEDEEEGGAWW
jgi:hypothetical protein